MKSINKALQRYGDKSPENKAFHDFLCQEKSRQQDDSIAAQPGLVLYNGSRIEQLKTKERFPSIH